MAPQAGTAQTGICCFRCSHHKPLERAFSLPLSYSPQYDPVAPMLSMAVGGEDPQQQKDLGDGVLRPAFPARRGQSVFHP